jgi:hypothetical protein
LSVSRADWQRQLRAIARSYWLEPELDLELEAPEGGGSIRELAVLRAP